MTASPAPSPQCHRSMSVSSLRECVRILRLLCREYELETDRIKRDEVKKPTKGDTRNVHLLVDIARGPIFKDLRKKLLGAESELAAWKPKKKFEQKTTFSSMVKGALR